MTQQGAVCPTHNTKWFKTEKMRGFAHRIVDTNDWCNQDERVEQQASARAPQSQPANPRPAARPGVDPTRQSIERQTALKAAVEYAGQKQQGSEHDIIDVVTIAEEFYRFLSNPPVAGPVDQEDADMPF